MKQLEQCLQDGYICGNKIPSGKRSMGSKSYVAEIELSRSIIIQERATRTAESPRKISVLHCSDDIVMADEIRKNHDRGGKIFVLVCRSCFDSALG